MFRMLYNYSGQTYARTKIFATAMLTYCGSREAELPICVLQQPSPSASMESGPLSPPLDHLKVAVHTTTDRFGDKTLQTEEKGGI